jgi:hypothetical protein
MIFEETKKAKCLPIWNSSSKFTLETRATKKLKHKRKKGGKII